MYIPSEREGEKDRERERERDREIERERESDRDEAGYGSWARKPSTCQFFGVLYGKTETSGSEN